MNIKTAKKLLGGIAYSQGRNRVSGRPVKEITITPEDLIKKYSEQEGKCYWSNLPLNEEYNFIKHHPFAISPERLDNSKPYSYENIVLTRRIFNLGRMAFPAESFQNVMNQLREELKKDTLQ